MLLPENVAYILSVLRDAGYSAYAVGGAVRDNIMGLPAHDWDITTNALPIKVKELFSEFAVIDTGIKHGTVSVIIEKEPFEITTFRTESGYSDFRHPDSVSFSARVEDDLRRRDFTMNAIAFSQKEGFVDPFGGENDIKASLIRCVGNARERFCEDALRILRALRFSSVLGFEIEKETGIAAEDCRGLLKNISAERIFSELKKLLCGKNVENVLLKYKKIIFEIIPELSNCDGFDQKNPHHIYNVYEHIVKSVAVAPNELAVRLALLLHDIAKPQCFFTDENGVGHFYGHDKKSAETARKILRRLKCDNTTLDDVVFLIENHMTELRPETRLVKRRLSRFGERRLRMLVQVQRADTHACGTGAQLDRFDSYTAKIDEIVKEGQCFSLKHLAVNGNDIIQNGIATGADIGRVLQYLLELVIEEKAENEKSALLREAKMFAESFLTSSDR